MTKQEVAVRLLKAIFLEVISIVLMLIGYAFETEAVTLEPGEAYSVDISIPYPVARQDGTNNVKITATTGDTTATYKESFTH